MSMFTDIPNDHVPGQEDVPKRYWPVICAWDVAEASQGAPIYFVEFIRSTNIPIPRTWLVQEDLVLFDVIQQIGVRWMYTLKVFNPLLPIEDAKVSVISELWRVYSPMHRKDVALIRNTRNELHAPAVRGGEPEELLKDAKLVWHRKENVDLKH